MLVDVDTEMPVVEVLVVPVASLPYRVEEPLPPSGLIIR